MLCLPISSSDSRQSSTLLTAHRGDQGPPGSPLPSLHLPAPWWELLSLCLCSAPLVLLGFLRIVHPLSRLLPLTHIHSPTWSLCCHRRPYGRLSQIMLHPLLKSFL